MSGLLLADDTSLMADTDKLTTPLDVFGYVCRKKPKVNVRKRNVIMFIIEISGSFNITQHTHSAFSLSQSLCYGGNI